MRNERILTQGGKKMAGKALIRTMHIKRLYDAYLIESGEQLGLSLLEINVLLFLKNHTAYNTARDLCNMRMIPKSNASNGIRLLERKGMLRIEYDAENKKLHRLFLTEKADDVVKVLKDKQEEFMKELFGVLTEGEAETLDRIFDKLDQVAIEAMKTRGNELPEQE